MGYGMSRCLEERRESHKECAEEEDQGSKACDRYESKCCDWWPCSWACKVISWFCAAWVWVSNWVCVAWNTIVTVICVLWDLLTTLIEAIVTTLESTVGFLLDALAFVVGLFFTIPIIGRFLEQIWNAITSVFWAIVSVIDAGLGLIGIRPEKKLRVVAFILQDETGTPVVPTAFAVDQLQAAVELYRREANVRIVNHKPFAYTSAFASPPTPDDSWVTIVPSNADSNELLDLPCGADGVAHDLGIDGARMSALLETGALFGRFRRLIGYGGPVACIFVRSIAGGTEGASTFSPDPGDLGCCLWLTDYVTIRRQGPPTDTAIAHRVLAHELGHACNLWHSGSGTNLMRVPPDLSAAGIATTQSSLSTFQVVWLRASKHVTYF
jgi:hypothetical protein